MKAFLIKQILAALVISSLTGCAHKHVSNSAHLNAVVDQSCLMGPVLLYGCEPNSSPLKCRIISARYRPGCERWEVAREKPAEHGEAIQGQGEPRQTEPIQSEQRP